jgi:phosphotransferase system  glucose/maltose/N-acetylglucosamine-specific IIC component
MHLSVCYPLHLLARLWACWEGTHDHAKGTGGLIMFGTMEPWGYGGYGQFHMVIWIILAIAVVAGVVWRWALVRRSRQLDRDRQR